MLLSADPGCPPHAVQLCMRVTDPQVYISGITIGAMHGPRPKQSPTTFRGMFEVSETMCKDMCIYVTTYTYIQLYTALLGYWYWGPYSTSLIVCKYFKHLNFSGPKAVNWTGAFGWKRTRPEWSNRYRGICSAQQEKVAAQRLGRTSVLFQKTHNGARCC